MDISAYPLDEAKEYLNRLMRMRFNQIAIHSYPNLWHEVKTGDSTELAGNFFYNRPHPIPNLAVIKNNIRFNTTNFSDSLWMWGGGAQLGAKHFFNSNWFLDFSYGYFVTSKDSFNNSDSFTSTTISDGTSYQNRGTAYITSNQSVVLQSFTVALNYLF